MRRGQRGILLCQSSVDGPLEDALQAVLKVLRRDLARLRCAPIPFVSLFGFYDSSLRLLPSFVQHPLGSTCFALQKELRDGGRAGGLVTREGACYGTCGLWRPTASSLGGQAAWKRDVSDEHTLVFVTHAHSLDGGKSVAPARHSCLPVLLRCDTSSKVAARSEG